VVDGHQAHTLALLWGLHDHAAAGVGGAGSVNVARVQAATVRVAAGHPAAAAILATAGARAAGNGATPPLSPAQAALLQWVQAVAIVRGVRVWDAMAGLADGR